MKTLTRIFASSVLVVLSLFSVLTPVSSFALEQPYQGCTANSMAGSGFQMNPPDPQAGDEYGTEQYQTFVATDVSTINQIQVVISRTTYIEFSIMLFKQGSSDPLLYQEFTVAAPPGAVPTAYYATVSDLNIPLTLGDTYSVGIGAGPYTFQWLFSEDQNCDPHGSTSFRSIVPSENVKDFWYNIWGTYTAPPTPVVTPTPTPTTTPTTTVKPKISTAPAPAAAAPIDTTIGLPVLVRYDLAGKSYSAPFADEVSLEKGENIDIVGTSFAGAVVTVFVGEKSYLADVVANGDWAVTVKGTDLKEGSNTISAQAQKDESGSEIVDVLKVMVLGVKSEVAETNSIVAFLANPWVLGGMGLLLVVLIALLVFLELKFHGLAKLFRKLTGKPEISE